MKSVASLQPAGPGASPASGTDVPARRAGGLRWLIALFLLTASVINYIDRQALSILATTIQKDLGLSDTQYGRVAQAFLLCYAAVYLGAGRLVDRVGPRVAETLFMAWWSAANVLTTFVTGFTSLVACRCLLGIGEPGHYAVSAKVVGRWFPASERGIAAGMYTMGGTLGAALAGPIVAVIAIHLGWRWAFALTGIAGLFLAAAWYALYRDPADHPLLGRRERAYLESSGVLATAGSAARAAPLPLRTILSWKAVWIVMGVRMLTDPLWYFYLVWFAKYLQEVRGFTLADVGATVWVVFLAADAGCLLSGFAGGRLIRRGMPPARARLVVMTAAAVVLAFGFVLPWTPGRAVPLALASLSACAVMVFMTSAVTLPLDLFPASSLGSVQGIIGTGGSIGGAISTGVVAHLVTKHSYDAVFLYASFLHPLAILALWALLPISAPTTPAPQK